MNINQLSDNELNNLAKRVFFANTPRVDNRLVHQTVVEVSDSLTALQNVFGSILNNMKNITNIHQFEDKRLSRIKKEQVLESKSPAATLTGGTNAEASMEAFSSLAGMFGELKENLEKLDLTADSSCDVDSSDYDIDGPDKKKRRKKKGGRKGARRARLPKALKLGGRLLAPVMIGLDVYDRMSEDQSAGKIAAGVGGGALGAWAGAEAGAAAGGAIGAAFGGVGAVPGAAIGGLMGGAIGYMGGSAAGDYAYDKIAEPEKKPDLAKTGYSATFADFLSKSFATAAMITSPGLAMGLGMGQMVMDWFGGL